VVIETFCDKQMEPAAAATTSAGDADVTGDDGMAQRQPVAGYDCDEEQGAVGGQPAVVPSHEV